MQQNLGTVIIIIKNICIALIIVNQS